MLKQTFSHRCLLSRAADVRAFVRGAAALAALLVEGRSYSFEMMKGVAQNFLPTRRQVCFLVVFLSFLASFVPFSSAFSRAEAKAFGGGFREAAAPPGGGGRLAGTLSGYVYDELNGLPIPEAVIRLRPVFFQKEKMPLGEAGQEVVVRTDSTGYFSLAVPNLQPQVWELTLDKEDYESLELRYRRLPKEAQFFRLKMQALQLETVVVSSLQHEKRGPTSSTTLAAKKIEESYVGENMGFLLQRHTPSFIALGQSGTSFANYAGLRLRGMDETRINATLDGLPLNDMIDHGVYFSNFSDIAEGAARIKVQRGVSSSTFGSAAYAGSINIQTPTLFGRPRYGAQLTAGAFGSLKLSGEAYSGAIRPHDVGAYARFSYMRSNGYRRHSGTESYSFFSRLAKRTKNHLFSLLALLGDTRNDMSYLRSPESVLRKDPRHNPLSENEIDRFVQSLVALRHTMFLTREHVLGYTFYLGQGNGFFPFGFSVPSEEAGLPATYNQIDYRLRNTHWGLQLHAQGNALGHRLSWDVGMQGDLFFRHNEEASAPDSQSLLYADRSQKQSVQTFVKSSIRFGPWECFADLELRYVRLALLPATEFIEADIPARTWLFFNPKAGVRYGLGRHFFLYTSVGISQREPSRNDILGDTNINPGTLASAQDTNAPQSEQVVDVELGVSRDQGPLRGTLNVFYMDFSNEIAPTGLYIENFFAQLRRNIPRSLRLGVEADVIWQPGHWELRLLGTLMEARASQRPWDGNSELLGGAPQVQLQLHLGRAFRLWNQPMKLSVQGTYWDRHLLLPVAEAKVWGKPFFSLDASYGWQLGKYVHIGVQLRNGLNRRNYLGGELSGTPPQAAYLPQAGRHFYATLRLSLR